MRAAQKNTRGRPAGNRFACETQRHASVLERREGLGEGGEQRL